MEEKIKKDLTEELKAVDEGVELSDEDLGIVAGGFDTFEFMKNIDRKFIIPSKIRVKVQ